MTENETFQEVFDQTCSASGQNPYAEYWSNEAGSEFSGAPADPEQNAKYHAYEGYLDNVRESPAFYVGWNADDLAGAAESHADSEWTHYL